MSDSQDNPPPLDLSNLRLMPNWVADFGTSKSTSGADFPEEDTRGRRDFKDRGPGRGGFGDRRSGPGGGSGGGAGGGDRRSFDRSRSGPGAGPSGDRRGPGGAGGGGYRGDRDRGPRQYGQGQGQGYGRDDRDNRGHFDQAPRPVPGISVSVEPESRAMEAMAGMIRTAGKAYSVFDAARLVLANGDRFHVKFSLAADAPGKLYTVPVDGSLWLSREDALANFLQGDALKEYYVAEQIELEEPKGNFASIAVCGMTGELLGPPSHHSYQTNLHRLHRDRFSNLPFEEYKRRVRTDNSPEAVAKWKDSQKHGTEWVYQKGEVAEGAEPLRLKSRVDMENHFRKVHADTLVGEVSEATVAGSIPKKLLAPSLYIHLRRAVDEARKHLLATAQQLCSGFEHHGLKLFKRRGGKLWVSRVRPRALDASVVLSDRIAKLVELIKTKPGISTKELLDLMVPPVAPAPAEAKAAPAPAPAAETAAEAPVDEVQAPETAVGEVAESTENSAPEAAVTEDSAPADADAEAPVQAANVSAEAPEAVVATPEVSPEQVQALKDLHWLNSEGYVIEYADGVVFPGVTEPPPAKPKPVKAAPVAAAVVAGEAVADAAVDGVAVEGATETETEAAPAAEVAADETGEGVAAEVEAEAVAPEVAAEAPPEQAPVEAEAAVEAAAEVEPEPEIEAVAEAEPETASEEITEPDVTSGSTDPLVQAVAEAGTPAHAPAEAEVETEAQVAEEAAK